MNKDEYIIINKTAILKAIKLLDEANQLQRVDELENVLLKSTPLIPEIEKAFEHGCKGRAEIGYKTALTKKDYISNLKLDI